MKFKSVEDEFIILVVRTLLSPDCAERARALFRPDFNWDYIRGFLDMHRLRALFYESIIRLNMPEFPPDVLFELRSAALANLGNNALLMQETIHLVAAFQEMGLPVLVFKGVPFTQQLYNGLIYREISDIDLLLHPDDVVKAEAYLTERGFQLDSDGFEPMAGTLPKDEYHFTLKRAQPSLVVEIHWSLARRDLSRLRDPALFWDNATTVRLNSFDIPAPRIEVMPIFLCMHGFKHHWRRLAWVYDLSQFVYRFPDFDWSGVLEQAARLNGKRMMLQGLYLAHDIFAMPLPEVIRRELDAQPKIATTAAQMEDEIVKYPIEKSTMSDFVVQYVTRQGWTDRLNYLRANARPNENETRVLPDNVLTRPVMYVVRGYRLLRHYIIPWLTSRRSP